MNKLNIDAKYSMLLGTDPEGFFAKGGHIIGSEKLIPEKGIHTQCGGIVRDGVQFELHPRVAADIHQLGLHIGNLFASVRRVLDNNPGTSVCFDGLVEVSREELDSLSPDSRVLGCNPSHNVYGDKDIDVDPYGYRKRSAGGHLHMGLAEHGPLRQSGCRRAVPVLDILVGNTCVLLDRDPGCAERRENYGRAGECRFPNHGLEYRTTSNFWLRDYSLMSFVFGMAQLAHAVTQEQLGKTALWDQFTNGVVIKDIVTAINTNDFDLALQNFNRLVPFLQNALPPAGFPLTPTNIPGFIRLAEDIRDHGINSIFPEDCIIDNWINLRFVDFGEFIAQR